MKTLKISAHARALFVLLFFSSMALNAAVVEGELRKWHKITLTFDGPNLCENSSTNPFLDYRLNVTFTDGTVTMVVPGFFAADGDAAESSAACGDKWQVRFRPPSSGVWSWTASFEQGTDLAVNDWTGTPVYFDGETDSFFVAPTDKVVPDLRAQGLLQYVGEHYLRFKESRQWFLQSGTGSPENFLAFNDFDGTYTDPDGPGIDNTHDYTPHLGDWNIGDPVWQGTKGKGIIGAINYLASEKVNSMYFLTFNEQGDGDDVWPWTGPEVYQEYDVSKLEQWEIVFDHMDENGVIKHIILQEQENDQLLNWGNLGTERKLYYREMIARFGHHLGLIWNLGEENTNSDWQRKQHATYIRDNDPYSHLISTHTYTFSKDDVYGPLCGFIDYDGASLQVANPGFVGPDTQQWREDSRACGRPWVVYMSEIGPVTDGIVPDAFDWNHDDDRQGFLWPHLMHGGAGVEWYFGYSYPNNDLTCEDFRSRNNMWEQTATALELFSKLPFPRMEPRNDLVDRYQTYCFALNTKFYLIYFPNSDFTNLTLEAGNYRIGWYDTKNGGDIVDGGFFTMPTAGTYLVENTSYWNDYAALVLKQGGTPLRIEAEFPALSEVLNVQAAPNPADEFMTLSWLGESDAQLEIFDMTGRLVESRQTRGDRFELSTGQYASGIYTWRVRDGGGLSQTGKFEVRH